MFSKDTQAEKKDPLKWIKGFLEVIALIVLISHLVGGAFVGHEVWVLIIYIILLSIAWTGLSTYQYVSTIRLQEVRIAADQETISNLSKQLTDRNLLNRKARYVDALKDINVAFAQIHDVYRDHSKKTFSSTQELEEATKKFRTVFVHFCNDIERAFTHISGYKCAVCIKIFIEDKNQNERSVHTFVRDHSSSMSRKEHQDPSYRHKVRENTSYTHVFNNLGNPDCRSFYSNELPLEGHYNSTSFAIYGHPKQDHGKMTKEEKIANWRLPYKSTIVTALCPNLLEQFNREAIIGFLCLDCDEMDAFDPTSDNTLMVGIADGMYTSMNLFLQFLRDKKMKELSEGKKAPKPKFKSTPNS